MADDTPPPSFPLPSTISSSGGFISPDHASYDACMNCSYPGFVHEPASTLHKKFHKRFRKALKDLDAQETFIYDYTQPMGYNTSLARTRVRRCLVGKPGITYRYLGVRMFAHPWDGPQATKAAKRIQKLSKQLDKQATTAATATATTTSNTPSFNLTLINRMDPPETTGGGGAKPEKVFGMGQCSVSWHADSSLQHFTPISVYVAHYALDQKCLDVAPSSPTKEEPWRVALRLVPHVEGPGMLSKTKEDDTTTPAVAVPIHDGDIYHMLGNFNHHHQHAVLQGKRCVRYSSTHRVGLEEGHTVQSITKRAETTIRMSKDTNESSPEQWQEEQACLTELEFEWIRQWYGQGKEHSKRLGVWWNERIASLELLWSQLEQLTFARFQRLRQEAHLPGNGSNTLVSGKFLEKTVVLHGALTKRRRLRLSWAARELDPLLLRECPPIPCLFQGHLLFSGTLPEDLSNAIAEVESIQKSFSGQRKKQKPCFHFSKFGDCSKGKDCPFSHDSPQQPSVVSNGGEEPSQNLVSNDTQAALEWSFQDTDFGDHYETPKAAYAHVKPLLRKFAKAMGVQKEKLRIYDPYYCRGLVVSYLTDLGFPSVIHAKRDFYKDIADSKVPEHDVLLTNPPYSSDHKEKLFRFLLERQREAGEKDAPFLLLLPAWSASKLAWRQFLWCLVQLKKGRVGIAFEDAGRGERGTRVGAFSERLEEKAGCFFVCPPERYRFVAAVKSRQDAPFDGVWFCGGWRDPQAALKALSKATAKKAAKEKSTVTVCSSLAELRTTKLLPTADETRSALGEDDAAKRKQALAELDKVRRSDPGWVERKRRKTAESRDQSKMSIGHDLDEKTKQRVLSTPKACRHFFGLTNGGGCTQGESCRFLHTLP